MSAAEATTSTLRMARLAGLFYLVTFATGIASLLLRGSLAATAVAIAGASYVVVTLLFYVLFKPVSPGLSLFAAAVGLAGAAAGPLELQPLVFFGFYCLLIACLIYRSRFLPRFLAALMAFAALGWLTFLWPPLAHALSPYVFGPGILGEGALTFWLLAHGVDAARWREQARLVGVGRAS